MLGAAASSVIKWVASHRQLLAEAQENAGGTSLVVLLQLILHSLG